MSRIPSISSHPLRDRLAARPATRRGLAFLCTTILLAAGCAGDRGAGDAYFSRLPGRDRVESVNSSSSPCHTRTGWLGIPSTST